MTISNREAAITTAVMFRNVLGRNPTAEDLSHHCDLLSGGLSLRGLANALLASPEASSCRTARGQRDDDVEFLNRLIADIERGFLGCDAFAAVFAEGVPVDDPAAYAWWLDDLTRTRSRLQDRPPASMGQVHFVLQLDGVRDVKTYKATRASISKQTDDRWRVIFAGSPFTLWSVRRELTEGLRNRKFARWIELPWSAVRNIPGRLVSANDLVCWLTPDDTLALDTVAELLRHPGSADVILTDGDRAMSDGTCREPHCGGSWDPDAALTQPPGGLVAIRAKTLRRIRRSVANSQHRSWEILIRASELVPPATVQRLPLVLRHRSRSTAMTASEKDDAVELLRDHLARTGRGESTVAPEPYPSIFRITYPVPRPEPLVSLVILTRDHSDLLEVCLDGVLRRTEYLNFEVILVDNGSIEEKTHRLFSNYRLDRRVTILRDERPFDWSALNHFGITASRGDVIVLMNNDMDVIGPDWLSSLVSHAIRPDVGVVGAKLLYPRGAFSMRGSRWPTDPPGISGDTRRAIVKVIVGSSSRPEPSVL